MELDTLQVNRPEAPNGQADRASKRGPKTEYQKLEDALKVVDGAIETLKQTIKEAEACKVPGMDVRYNLGLKLGTLLKETGLKIPRGAKV